jgi:8-oxo-dGTP pyrophosphatase MutT (NUDIX family)
MWLPPGGHVDPNELPDEAAVREVREETGVLAELVGERPPRIGDPIPLVRPEGVQLERIGPGHEHIDLVYFARRLEGEIVPCPECERAGWYRLDELAALGVNAEIQAWSRRAVAAVAARLGALESARGAS